MAELIRTATVGLSLQLLIPGQLAFLSRHFDVLAVGSGKDVMAAVGRREGVRVEAVEMRRRPSPLADLASLWRLYQLFRREMPLIVHSMTPKAGLLSMLAARLAGVPCRIHTFTGLVFPSRRGVERGLLLRADRLICRLATCVIPEGAGVARDLARFGVTGAMPQVVGPGNVNGIDSEYFDPAVWGPERVMAHRREVLTDPEAFVFIFVGRLVRDKGMAELAEAFVAVQAEMARGIALVLLGDEEPTIDPLEPRTRELLERNPGVLRTGFVDDVRPWLAMADCFVLPSHREGFPNAVLQAAAMGLPSIVTDVNGCNEIIENGHNGLVVPPHDAVALGDAMRRMIDDRCLREALRSRARQSVVPRFERSEVWMALLKLYRSCLQALSPDGGYASPVGGSR